MGSVTGSTATNMGENAESRLMRITLTHGSSQKISWHLGMTLELYDLTIGGCRKAIEQAIFNHESWSGKGRATCEFVVQNGTVIGLHSIEGNVLALAG